MKSYLFCGVAVLSLSACGGGGGAGPQTAGSNAPIDAPTPTPVPVATPSPSPVPSPTPTPVPTPTPMPTPLPTPTPTPLPTPSPTPSPVPTPTPTPVPTPTPTPPAYQPPVSPPAGYTITQSSQQPTRSANDTAEFRRNYGANEFVNALYALDHGYTGQGVTVGVIDDGVNTSLSAFSGQIDTANSMDFGYVTTGGVRNKRNAFGGPNSDHGSAVAAIIAARRDGEGTVGYAPDAKIAVLRVDDYNTDTGVEMNTHAYEAMGFAADRGIKILSLSLVTDGQNNFGAALTNYANKAKGLVVQSAGNGGAGASGGNPADYSVVNASNIDSILFVVASNGALLTSQFGLASYSNQAGSMMLRTVTAPGTNVTTLVDGSIGNFSGTSSAAPVVAAIAADILSKWPQLTGQQAGSVILNTARDIGAPGPDAVFGMGMVDVERALSPINPTLSNGLKQSSINAAVMVVPGPFNMTQMQAVLSSVTVLDSYGRDYQGSIAGMVVKPQVTDARWLRRRVAQMGLGGGTSISLGGLSGSFAFASERVGAREGEVRSYVTTGKVGWVGGGFGIRASWNGADDLQSDVMGLAPFADGILAYVPQAANSFGVDRYLGDGSKVGLTVAFGRYAGSTANAATLGWSKGRTDVRVSLIDEDGTLMGVPAGAGALRLGQGATTAMVEAQRTFNLAGGWLLEGYSSIGVTRLKIDSMSLVTGSTPILSSRLGIQASAALLGGVASFGIAQPLTIESGAARLTYGNGYDLASQSLTYATADASLAGQRRMMLTAGFARGGPRSMFRVGLGQYVGNGSVRVLGSYGLRF